MRVLRFLTAFAVVANAQNDTSTAPPAEETSTAPAAEETSTAPAGTNSTPGGQGNNPPSSDETSTAAPSGGLQSPGTETTTPGGGTDTGSTAGPAAANKMKTVVAVDATATQAGSCKTLGGFAFVVYGTLTTYLCKTKLSLDTFEGCVAKLDFANNKYDVTNALATDFKLEVGSSDHLYAPTVKTGCADKSRLRQLTTDNNTDATATTASTDLSFDFELHLKSSTSAVEPPTTEQLKTAADEVKNQLTAGAWMGVNATEMVDIVKATTGDSTIDAAKFITLATDLATKVSVPSGGGGSGTTTTAASNAAVLALGSATLLAVAALIV